MRLNISKHARKRAEEAGIDVDDIREAFEEGACTYLGEQLKFPCTQTWLMYCLTSQKAVICAINPMRVGPSVMLSAHEVQAPDYKKFSLDNRVIKRTRDIRVYKTLGYV